MAPHEITDDQINAEMDWISTLCTSKPFVIGCGLGISSESENRIILVSVMTEADQQAVLLDKTIPRQVEFPKLGLTLPLVVEVIGEVSPENEEEDEPHTPKSPLLQEWDEGMAALGYRKP